MGFSEPPDIRGLQTLAAVAKCGSLTAASSALGVTQQAVSSRIRALEVRTGSELVARSPGGSRLTETGLLVAGWAANVLTAADRFEVSVASLRAAQSGQLSVAASLTIAEHLVPDWLLAFHSDTERPASVDLTVANSRTVVDRVRGGSCEIGFIETPDVPGDLDSRLFGHDELVVVVGASHAWAGRRRAVTVRELARTPLIVREEGSGTRRLLELALAALDPPLAPHAPASVLPTTTAIRSTIASGAAPGVLSSLAIRDDVTLGRLIPVRVTGVTLIRPLTAIWARKPAGLSANAERLLSVVKVAQR